MKTSINKVTLRGFLGSNPEIKELATDKKLAKVSLATTEGYKNAAREWVNETTWHNLVFWDKWASFAELNLKKGICLYVDGKLINRSYKDNEGVVRYITEVVVSQAIVVEGD